MQTQIQENTQGKAQINELPLLELFTRLRQAGLPLGTSEYQLMLKALRAGHGLPDKAALARLCQTLWVKSEEDQIVFNYHFAEVMAQDEQIFEEAITAESVSELEETATRQNPVVSRLRKLNWPTRIALGGTVAAGIAVAMWSAITPATEQKCPIFISSPPNIVGRGERYSHTVEVQACEGNSQEDIEISIPHAHPWLAVTGQANGSAVISGDSPNHTIYYSQSALFNEAGDRISDFNGISNFADLKVSQNGKIIVTRAFSGTAQLWNSQGQLLGNFGGKDTISDLAISANGQRIITYSTDETAQLWNNRGQLLSDFGGADNIYKIQFVAESSLVLTQSTAKTSRFPERDLRLWSDQGEQLAELGQVSNATVKLADGRGNSDILFLEDRQQLLVLSTDGKIQLWNARGETVGGFEGATDVARFYRVLDSNTQSQRDRDGEQTEDEKIIRIITHSIDGAQYLWNLEGERLSELSRATDGVGDSKNLNYYDYAVQGPFIVGYALTGRSENTVQLWTLQGKPIAGPEGRFKFFSVLALKDGNQLLTISSDNIARLLDTQGNYIELGKIDRRRRRSRNSNFRIIEGKDLIFIRSPDKTVSLWNINGELVSNFDGHRNIKEILASGSDRPILTYSSNKVVQAWSDEGELISELGRVRDFPNDVLFSLDGERLFLKSPDNTVRLKTVQGRSIAEVGKVNSFSARYVEENEQSNEQLAVFYLLDNKAQLWNDKGDLIASFEDVDSVRFYEEHQRIVTYSFIGKSLYGHAQLYDYAGNLLSNFQGLDDIANVQFFTDSQWIATLSQDKTVRVWDQQENKVGEFHSIHNLSVDTNNLIADASSVPIGGPSNRSRANNGIYINKLSDSKSLIVFSRNSDITIQASNNITGEKNKQTFMLRSFNDSSAFDTQFGRWLIQFRNAYFALLIAGLLLYSIARRLLLRHAKPVEFPSLPESTENAPSAIATLNKALEDEMQVAQTVRQQPKPSLPDAEPSSAAISETSDYFPVTRRQMKQSWRSLRRMVRKGPPVELDITATIEQTGREGMLLEPVLRPRRINRNELLLLIDQDGSMVPFHALSERLAETALQGGRLARTGIRYFHNCPVDYLYRDPYHQEADSISDVIGQLPAEYTGVLIFSDGGAARGGFNQERLELTAAFLGQLRQQLRYVAWLNPMPRDRWTGTAGEIAKLLPMFELSRHGLNQSIDVLRGKSVHWQAGETL